LVTHQHGDAPSLEIQSQSRMFGYDTPTAPGTRTHIPVAYR
jgi:hypothetical protein